jgi:hypothetical protein
MIFSLNKTNKFFWVAVALLCAALPLVAEQSKLIDELIFAESSQISKNKLVQICCDSVEHQAVA